MSNNVVNLGKVRDLLLDWETMRSELKAGRITGYNLTVCTEDGEERIFLGGFYKADPMAALKAQLRMSGARMLADDEPPAMRLSL